MLFSHRQVGDKGEDLACRYLRSLGYQILERNFIMRGGEIDIIAKDKESLVFVEVKTRYSHAYGLPIESITSWKIQSLLKTAELYIQKNRWGPKSYRFDCVSIDFTNSKDNPEIELIKNITE